MTLTEKALIRKAEKVFAALERVAQWNGTGSVRQEQAYAARDKALAEWEATVASLSQSSR